MRKNNLVILIFVLIIIVIGIGWILFFRSRGGVNNQSSPEVSLPFAFSPVSSPKTESSPAPIPQFLKLFGGEVLTPGMASKTIVFFDKTNGLFRSLLPLLDIFKEDRLSETVFSNVFSVSWSSNYKAALIGFYQGQTRRFAVFDFQQNLSHLLPEYAKEAVWSFDSNQLLINHFEPQKELFYLATLNPDGTKEAKIIDLKLSDAVLFYAGKNTILFYQKPAPDFLSERFFSYDLKTKKLLAIDAAFLGLNRGAYGFDMLPSPNGESVLFSTTDASGAGLGTFVYNLKTNRIVSTKFATLVQKCAWTQDSDEVVCAYSSQLTQGQGLPFEYWKGRVQSNDSFAKFNLRTGEMKIYAVNAGYDAVSLIVGPEKDFLLFINQADQALYRMSLK